MKHSVLFLLLLGAFRLPAAEMLRLESSLDAMGSTYTIVVYGDDRDRLQSTVEQAFEEVRRLDNMLSNYRPESEWSQVNQLAAQQPVRVSHELFSLLTDCVRYSQQSEGTFDITVGPLMKVWGFYKGSGHLPQRSAIESALSRTGYRNLILNPNKHTVRFAQAGVEIDPGGIGKGYAVDRVAAILKENGVRSGFISASTSSIYAIGVPPDEPTGWKVNIRDPKVESKTAATVYLRDQSLSTSGTYEKFFLADGKVYAHIMDPRTGRPAPGMLSVSVVTPKTIDSEAWAKPYFILGRKWTMEHKSKEFRVFLCEDRSENTCAWLQ